MQYRKKRKLRIGRIVFAILMIGILATTTCLFMGDFVKKFDISDLKLSGKGSFTSSKQLQNADYQTVEKNTQDVHEGDLILVNHDYPYTAKEDATISSVYDLKNEFYYAKDKNVLLKESVMSPLNQMMKDFYQSTKKNNVMLISGARDKEKQAQLYQDDLKANHTEASTLVAKPGYSEHHTALVFDIGLYNPGQSSSYDGTGPYEWINSNCANYGFVVRYDQSKTSITKIDNEPWHFRYVGLPHSQIMTEKNLCLEEYIDFLKKYPVNQEHLLYTDKNHATYEIYYVPADKKVTQVQVPNNFDYTISGNNIDGFIVTVTRETEKV